MSIGSKIVVGGIVIAGAGLAAVGLGTFGGGLVDAFNSAAVDPVGAFLIKGASTVLGGILGAAAGGIVAAKVWRYEELGVIPYIIGLGLVGGIGGGIGGYSLSSEFVDNSTSTPIEQNLETPQPAPSVDKIAFISPDYKKQHSRITLT